MIGLLVLLVDHDEPQLGKGGKERRAGAYHHVDRPCPGLFVLLIALSCRKPGMHHRHPVPEGGGQLPYGLIGKGDLRNQHDGLFSQALHIFDEPDIHQGLSASRNAKKQGGPEPFLHVGGRLPPAPACLKLLRFGKTGLQVFHHRRLLLRKGQFLSETVSAFFGSSLPGFRSFLPVPILRQAPDRLHRIFPAAVLPHAAFYRKHGLQGLIHGASVFPGHKGRQGDHLALCLEGVLGHLQKLLDPFLREARILCDLRHISGPGRAGAAKGHKHPHPGKDLR